MVTEAAWSQQGGRSSAWGQAPVRGSLHYAGYLLCLWQLPKNRGCLVGQPGPGVLLNSSSAWLIGQGSP